MQRRGALFGMPGGSGSRKMAAGDIGELLVPHMPTIRVPRSGDRVYKNECAFSYDSPVSEARRRSGRLGGGSRCGRPVAAGSRGTQRHVKRREKMRSGRRGPPSPRGGVGSGALQFSRHLVSASWVLGAAFPSTAAAKGFAPPAFLGGQGPRSHQPAHSPAAV